jgi:two-component system, chemotaxis family, CheB/CheR fusion protein
MREARAHSLPRAVKIATPQVAPKRPLAGAAEHLPTVRPVPPRIRPSYAASIVETADRPLLVLGTDLRVRWANRCFYETFAISPQESRGALVYELGAPSWNVPELRDLLDAILEHRRHGEYGEIERRFSAIGRRTTHLSARIIRQAKRGSLILLGFEDVTDRKRNDDTRRMFLAAASHDALNALGNIAGYAELLAGNDLSDPVVPRILGLSARLSEIMRDLLDESRGTRGAPTLAVVSARTLVRERAAAIEWRCKQKGVTLRVGLPAEGEMTTDPGKLGRILDNMLSNAIRYTARGRVHLHAELTHADLSVMVRDTGIGIPAEDLGRVFEQYYRAPAAKRVEPLGTGLGLFTVKRFCELLGGTARIESTPGEGTTCSVVLPRRSPSFESTSALGPGGR